ncbi:MAG: signal peptide peptidase SppA [Desulfobulbaceae bacterium]|uniref:Signal peptide peptidase SppA n=1 Tax=Candidatus Desulfobia pelagia TaxID=2841692 RepID=A0A8J6TGI3_9BACT|nr:signal peptide peptidase SppA [Candidatus Desulfobia pelagia]
MSQKRLFLQKHPVLTGFFILGVLTMLFVAGITFFIARLVKPAQGVDFFGAKEVVGIVELKGVITSPEKAMAQLIRFQENAQVKAVIIRIDSPGGTVGASQELFQQIRTTNKTKPVVASMGSVAASGGYYAALGAEKIVASPGTLTGSIGVILKFPNLEEIFEKIGYKNEIVKSGALKDLGSSSRTLTQEERDLLQNLLDNVHNQFIADIVSSRNLTEEEVRGLADGRIFSGEQAKELGLIDRLGNLYDAVALAAELAGMSTLNPDLYYPEEEGFSLFKLLAGQQSTTSLLDHLPLLSPTFAYEWSVSK